MGTLCTCCDSVDGTENTEVGVGKEPIAGVEFERLVDDADPGTVCDCKPLQGAVEGVHACTAVMYVTPSDS